MVKLLLVDGQPVFRQGLAALLKKESPEFDVVGEAAGSAEAMALAERLTPDIVIMDILSRNGDGLEATRTIHERFPRVKVMILTALDEEDDLFQALRAGASGYLLKTAKLSELIDSIRTIAGGDSILSPSLIKKLVKEFRTGTSRNNPLFTLTPREKEVLQLASAGASNKEIAEKCYISVTTVKAHFRSILGKLEVKNRTGAVALATANGLLKKALCPA